MAKSQKALNDEIKAFYFEKVWDFLSELGEDVINRVLEAIKDECFIEQAPKTLGRVLGALIGPPRKNASKSAPAASSQDSAEGGIRISVS
jgi:hypothetical protein